MNINATITIDLSEVLYDIRNKTHIDSEVLNRTDDKTFMLASLMQVSDEDSTLYYIRRSLVRSYNDLLLIFKEFIEQPMTVKADNQLPAEVEQDGTLQLRLSLPFNYDRNALSILSQSIHNYLVNSTIGDWYTSTSKENSEIYLTQAEADKMQITASLYSRKRPIKQC